MSSYLEGRPMTGLWKQKGSYIVFRRISEKLVSIHTYLAPSTNPKAQHTTFQSGGWKVKLYVIKSSKVPIK